MPRRSKTSAFIGELFISKENYERLLMWGQSTKEIAFICLGKGKNIEDIYRLSNIANNTANFYTENNNERKMLLREKRKKGQIVLANGHSHPKKHHNQHPSNTDIKYNIGTIQLIIFSPYRKIGAWKIRKTKSETLSSELEIKITL